MSHRVAHCPFLNRADTRCANHFSLERLDDAFDHCFGSYPQCGTYQELLAERHLRQAQERTETGLSDAHPARVAIVHLPVVVPLAHAHR